MDWTDFPVGLDDTLYPNEKIALNAHEPLLHVPDPVGDPVPRAALSSDVELALFEEEANATEIGVNVAWFSGSQSNDIVLFVDQLKGARPWDDPSNTGAMTYDENGYPTTVPDRYVVSQLLIRSADLEGIDPHTGDFRLYGQGSGDISLSSSGAGTLVSRVDTDTLATEVIDGTTYWYVDVAFSVAPDEEIGQLKMLIHDIVEGNHLRDMALVHHTHLDAHRDGEVFAPELIEDLKGYGTLRLMDWMRANKIEEDGNGWGPEGSNWTSPDPEQRYVGTDHYTFNNHAGGALNEGRYEVSVPIEHVVTLANQVGADPWINLPVDITDARAAEMARYVSENLDEGLTARWEYGNELFNDLIGFEGYRYAMQMAHATFEDFDEIGAGAAAEWAAYRGPQVYEVIGDVFDADNRDTRFVAPGWAFSGSLKDNGDLTNGYLVRYFAAEEARKVNDGTPLPLDVVTDYSVAMYYGGTLAEGHKDATVAYHILDTVEGADAQANKLADWLTFGSREDSYLRLDTDAIETPVTGVTWTDDLEIGVTQLIWEDLGSGLDPLTDLEQVLRLEGNMLQYRALGTGIWNTVVQFTNAPGQSLSEMIEDADLIGFGGKFQGRIYDGLRSSVVNSAVMRLDAHAGYAEVLGLNFVAYEGGSHVSYPVDAEGAFDTYDAFNNNAAGASVFARWLEVMSAHGLDEYMHFMSHSRTNGNDWWGVQDYIGQDVEDEPEAIVLREAIAAYDPAKTVSAVGPLAVAESVRATPTGQLVVDMPVIWFAADGWELSADGSATETSGDIEQLRLENLLPVTEGLQYNLSLEIGLDGVAETELRIIARAMGDGSAELLSFRDMVVDGQALSFDLGEMPEGMSSLYLAIQRVGQDRSGDLTILGADLAEVGADVPVAPVAPTTPPVQDEPPTQKTPPVPPAPIVAPAPIISPAPVQDETPPAPPAPVVPPSVDDGTLPPPTDTPVTPPVTQPSMPSPPDVSPTEPEPAPEPVVPPSEDNEKKADLPVTDPAPSSPRDPAEKDDSNRDKPAAPLRFGLDNDFDAFVNGGILGSGPIAPWAIG